MKAKVGFVVAALALVQGCVEGGSGDEGASDDGGNEETEEITRVALTFTPDGGGAPVTAALSDPDGNGGASGTSDPITLTVGTTYTLTIEFRDDIAQEDITEEIMEEAEQHFVLIYGDTVSSPASNGGMVLVTQAYADVESDYAPNEVGDDLPVGLQSTIEATTAGTGEFRVMLRHLPPLNGNPVKTASIPNEKATGQLLPGEPDADVGFVLTVK